MRQRECLFRLVLLEARLHEHGVDVRERVPVELLEEPRAPFSLHRPHADRRDRLLEKMECRVQEVPLRVPKISEPSMWKREHLFRLVLHEPRLHQHQFVRTKKNAVLLLRCSCQTFGELVLRGFESEDYTMGDIAACGVS